MHTVLLIDDDKEVLSLNAKYLSKNGYHVVLAPDAVSGLKSLEKYHPDCIVLDIMMPNMNGFTACREFRKHVDVPIIFLTGKTSEEDKIKGLLIGADDYMIKPYSLKELAARIHVNIRRYEKINTSATQLQFPPLSIDLVQHKAYIDNEEIPVSNREFEFLYLLAQNKNQTVTFQQIGERLWGNYKEEDRRSIMVNASRLRKKLLAYPGLENIIETVWSQGYKFVYHN